MSTRLKTQRVAYWHVASCDPVAYARKGSYWPPSIITCSSYERAEAAANHKRKCGSVLVEISGPHYYWEVVYENTSSV